MRIFEIIGKDAANTATVNIAQNAKQTRKFASVAQKDVMNYTSQPQKRMPTQLTSQNQSPIQPSLVLQQNRVSNLVRQIAANSKLQQPTETEKVLAFRKYCQLKTLANQNYAERLRQQLAHAEAAARRT